MSFNDYDQQTGGIIYTPPQSEKLQDSAFLAEDVIESDTITSDSKSSSQINSHVSSKKTASIPSKETSSNTTTSIESSSDTSTSRESSSNQTTSREESLPNSRPDSSQNSSTSSTSTPTSSTSTSSMPTSSTPSSSFESEPTSSEASNDQVAKENEKKVGELLYTYGVNITIAKSQKDFSSEHIIDFAQNSTDVKNELNQIELSLKSFPTNLFIQTSTAVNFVLISKTTSGKISTTDSALIVPCFQTVNTDELNVFLLSKIAKNLLEQVSPNYDDYNPRGFFYGETKPQYNYSQSLPSTGYFSSLKAQESPEDDLYETFMSFFKNTSTLQRVPASSPYYKKLKYTCNLLVKWADCFREISIVNKFL